MALHKRAGGRQRDEVRDVAAHAVQHQERRVGIGAANVYVLAKNGELLGQIAVQLRQLLKARLVVNAPLVPLLKRVCATADDGNVELVGAFDQRIANRRQLPQHLAGRMANVGRNLDHAVGHLRHHAADQRVFQHQAQHIFSVGRQVIVVRVDQLQFQLNAQRQWFRFGEGFKTHGCLLCQCLGLSAAPRVWSFRPRDK